jgi:hypothetical protein
LKKNANRRRTSIHTAGAPPCATGCRYYRRCTSLERKWYVLLPAHNAGAAVVTYLPLMCQAGVLVINRYLRCVSVGACWCVYGSPFWFAAGRVFPSSVSSHEHQEPSSRLPGLMLHLLHHTILPRVLPRTSLVLRCPLRVTVAES